MPCFYQASSLSLSLSFFQQRENESGIAYDFVFLMLLFCGGITALAFGYTNLVITGPFMDLVFKKTRVSDFKFWARKKYSQIREFFRLLREVRAQRK